MLSGVFTLEIDSCDFSLIYHSLEISCEVGIKRARSASDTFTDN